MALKINVKGNINIKKRFIVNGREYASVEEMPKDARRAYTRAMENASRGGPATNLAARQTRIVFNGREYENVSDMPEDIRRLYDAAMMTLEAEVSVNLGAGSSSEAARRPLGLAGTASAPSLSMSPIEVGGGTASRFSRVVTLGIVILMLSSLPVLTMRAL